MSDAGSHGGSSAPEMSVPIIYLTTLLNSSTEGKNWLLSRFVKCSFVSKDITFKIKDESLKCHSLLVFHYGYSWHVMLLFLVNSSSKHIFQIDFTPTLSGLLGLPIPINSIGKVSPLLFSTFSWRKRLYLMYLNAYQVVRIAQNSLEGILI